MNRGQAVLIDPIGLISAVTLLMVVTFLEFVIVAFNHSYVFYPLHGWLKPPSGYPRSLGWGGYQLLRDRPVFIEWSRDTVPPHRTPRPIFS